MEEIAKDCRAAEAEAFAGLKEAYGMIAEIQGQSSAHGHKHARVLGLQIEAELKAFNAMPVVEREKFITRKLNDAYDYLRKCCTNLYDARAKVVALKRRCGSLKVGDLELVYALAACLEAEQDVEICEIAVNVAEDDVFMRVKQRRHELHCIHGNSAEAQDKICRMVAGMVVKMKAIKKTAICGDTFGNLS